MKRVLALLLSVVLVLLSAMPVFAAEPSDASDADIIAVDEDAQVVLDSVLEYIEQNTIVTTRPDGMQMISLVPVSADAAGVRAPKIVTEAAVTQPVYAGGATGDYTYTTGQTHTPISLNQRFLYSLLSDKYKAYYREIDAAVRGLDNELRFDSYDKDMVLSGKLYFLYMFDTPELFYLGNTVLPIYDNMFYTMSGYRFLYAAGRNDTNIFSPECKVSQELYNRIMEKKAAFDAAAREIVATIPVDAPQMIKERLIYTHILRNSYYNQEAVWRDKVDICVDDWNAFGVLCKGYGVCESYAEAFQMLCHMVGIECTGVIGFAGEGHKWNAVKIDGEWYQCDVTWDDPIGGDPMIAYSTYFNVTDAQLTELGHDWEDCEWQVPVCTAKTNGRDVFHALYAESTDGTIHYFGGKCSDTVCDNCGFTREAVEHTYSGNNDTVCDVCGDTHRPSHEHVYTNACDTTCNTCGDVREIQHTYTSDCDHNCNVCGLGRNSSVAHLYDNAVDASCNVCGNVRGITYTGWLLEGGKWAYYRAGAKLVSQWQEDSKGWCYLGADGYMKTNEWVKDSVGWCFVGADGYCVTNEWKEDSIGWCYLDKDGRMAVNQWIKDSVGWCFVGADGYCVTNCWKRDSIGWCYLNGSGRMAVNAWVRDSIGWCYVGADGYAVTNCWKRDSVGWCYLDSEGSMTKSAWVQDGGKWYYCDASGYMLANTSRYIGNKTYYFNASGVCTNP